MHRLPPNGGPVFHGARPTLSRDQSPPSHHLPTRPSARAQLHCTVAHPRRPAPPVGLPLQDARLVRRAAAEPAARPSLMRQTSPAPAPLPPTTAPAPVPWPPALCSAVSSTQPHACGCPCPPLPLPPPAPIRTLQHMPTLFHAPTPRPHLARVVSRAGYRSARPAAPPLCAPPAPPPRPC